MAELILIKTDNSKEVKKVLEAKHISYEIYQETIWKKSKENIFSDYKEVLKDKELEKEKYLLEKTDEEDEYDEYEQEDWAL